MKVNYTTSNKRISVEFEGDSQRDILSRSANFKKYLSRAYVANVATRIYAS